VASYFHPFKAGVAKLGNNIIGTYGEIHPKILNDFNLPAKICGFEINLDVLPSPKLKKPRLFEANNLQPIERDFAFILCEKTPVFDLIQAVKSVGRNLITSVDVFDVYQGKNLEKGKKSVGLRIIIQPVKTSLKEDEITAISTKIINKIESDFNAILRKTDIAT
jgi:phenylalanyl-tRNA synthetase beta chain